VVVRVSRLYTEPLQIVHFDQRVSEKGFVHNRILLLGIR